MSGEAGCGWGGYRAREPQVDLPSVQMDRQAGVWLADETGCVNSRDQTELKPLGYLENSQQVSSLINKPSGQMTNWWHCHYHSVKCPPLYRVQMKERNTLSSVWCA